MKGKPNILIVDDDAATRGLYAAMLQEDLKNVTINIAVNGGEGVKKFVQARPNLIVMDIHMPVVDGMAAYKRIYKCCRDYKWTMPDVIFCTSFTWYRELNDILVQNPSCTVLTKPVTSDQLATAVRSKMQGG